MKISLNWLKDYIELEKPLALIVEKLTLGGVEVEEVNEIGIEDEKIVVGEIVSWRPHPNADKLRVCEVFTGLDKLSIVCGAKNFDVGDRVVLALPGAVLPRGLQIGVKKIRGETSYGMLCSEKELGLSGESEGIMILSKEVPLGSSLSSFFPKDTILDLEITPNRSDLLCYIGIARELAALGVGKLKSSRAFQLASIGEGLMSRYGKVTIENKKKCLLYSGCWIENIRVGPSPTWLASRLKASGFKPINAVVDITNYVLLETGQPLHAFDAERFGSQNIIVRDGQKGELFVGLDGKEYVLDERDLVIASPHQVEALAGVIGGKASAVSSSTTSILLESAWFEPFTIQQTSNRLGIVTEASYRFARRVDPQGVIPGRIRAVELLEKVLGAKLVGGVIEGKIEASKNSIRLRKQKLEEFTALSWSQTEIEEKLKSLGLLLKHQTEKESYWEAPSFRSDLEIEEDLIEELVRLRGLSDIPSRISFGLASPSATEKEWDKVFELKQVLASKGYQECMTIPLVVDEKKEEEDRISLSNPASNYHVVLRKSFLRSLVEVANTNWRRGNKEIRIFEIGTLFFNNKGKVCEEQRLGILVGGETNQLETRMLQWSMKQRKIDFYDLKQLMDFLEQKKGFLEEDRKELFLVRSEDLEGLAVDFPCYYVEYSLERWKRESEQLPTYKPLPTQPSIRRDIALIVDKELKHKEILTEIRNQEVPFLESVELFDLFEDLEGIRIPKEKKSLAYALTFRAKDRTLTDEEVNAIVIKLKEGLRKKLSCSFRE